MTIYQIPDCVLEDGRVAPVQLRVDGGVIRGVDSGTPSDSGGDSVPGIVLPGLTNLHSHAFQRGLAGRTERRSAEAEDSFWSWRQAMYAYLADLTPERMEAVAAQLYVEMLEAGYTRVVEFHYLHRAPDGSSYADPAETSLRIVEAARRAGIGLTLLPVVYDSGGFGGIPLEPGQERFRQDVRGALAIRERLQDLEHVRPGLALHSLRGVSPDALTTFLEAEDAWSDGPVHIHVAEQPAEVDACLAWSGARPVEWLLEHAPVGPSWCLVHATHVSRPELQGIIAARAIVGLCPSTEANLGDGLFPLLPFLDGHGRWGVGSDSHVSVSPVEELRWLEYAQRVVHGARNVVPRHPGGATSTAATLLAGARAGGSAASGLPASGWSVGAPADLVVLDPDAPSLQGHGPSTWLDAWIFSGNRPAVRDVMVDGRWVVRDGRHVRGQEILAAFRAALPSP